MADNILIPLLVGLVVFEVVLYLIHRRRQRRLRAKDLAEAPTMDVWYLPAGWTNSRPPSELADPNLVPNGQAVPSAPMGGGGNPGAAPTPSRPPPTRHISAHLRTRGYVVLGVVEKWRGLPHPDDDVLPRYTPVAAPNARVDLDPLPAMADSPAPGAAEYVEMTDTHVDLPRARVPPPPTPAPTAPAAIAGAAEPLSPSRSVSSITPILSGPGPTPPEPAALVLQSAPSSPTHADLPSTSAAVAAPASLAGGEPSPRGVVA
ncbi:hypothetical protein H9P43_002096 [Blastocladiella emersonii ATCC 22665]|nr:hypothetical protein H9P43_002096 [Blastocladiella emersonii ATCC 22665]